MAPGIGTGRCGAQLEKGPVETTTVESLDCAGLIRGCSNGVRHPDSFSETECANIILVQSVIRGDLADVQRALGMGAQKDTTADLIVTVGTQATSVDQVTRVTPLMRAAGLGHGDIVRCLHAAGSSLIVCDSRGWPPLFHALASGELQVAEEICSILSREELRAHSDALGPCRADMLTKCAEEAGEVVASQVEQALNSPTFFAERHPPVPPAAAPGG